MSANPKMTNSSDSFLSIVSQTSAIKPSLTTLLATMLYCHSKYKFISFNTKVLVTLVSHLQLLNLILQSSIKVSLPEADNYDAYSIVNKMLALVFLDKSAFQSYGVQVLLITVLIVLLLYTVCILVCFGFYLTTGKISRSKKAAIAQYFILYFSSISPIFSLGGFTMIKEIYTSDDPSYFLWLAVLFLILNFSLRIFSYLFLSQSPGPVQQNLGYEIAIYGSKIILSALIVFGETDFQNWVLLAVSLLSAGTLFFMNCKRFVYSEMKLTYVATFINSFTLVESILNMIRQIKAEDQSFILNKPSSFLLLLILGAILYIYTWTTLNKCSPDDIEKFLFKKQGVSKSLKLLTELNHHLDTSKTHGKNLVCSSPEVLWIAGVVNYLTEYFINNCHLTKNQIASLSSENWTEKQQTLIDLCIQHIASFHPENFSLQSLYISNLLSCNSRISFINVAATFEEMSRIASSPSQKICLESIKISINETFRSTNQQLENSISFKDMIESDQIITELVSLIKEEAKAHSTYWAGFLTPEIDSEILEKNSLGIELTHKKIKKIVTRVEGRNLRLGSEYHLIYGMYLGVLRNLYTEAQYHLHMAALFSSDAARKIISKGHSFTQEAVIIIDGSKTTPGKITFASKTIQQVLGYTPESLFGKNVSIIMPKYFAERHDEFILDYLETGESSLMYNSKDLYAINDRGEAIPIRLNLQFHSSSKNSCTFLGRIQLNPSQLEYLVINIQGDLICVTEKAREMLRLPKVIGKEFNISRISPQFEQQVTDHLINQLKGTRLRIDTSDEDFSLSCVFNSQNELIKDAILKAQNEKFTLKFKESDYCSQSGMNSRWFTLDAKFSIIEIKGKDKLLSISLDIMSLSFQEDLKESSEPEIIQFTSNKQTSVLFATAYAQSATTYRSPMHAVKINTTQISQMIPQKYLIDEEMQNLTVNTNPLQITKEFNSKDLNDQNWEIAFDRHGIRKERNRIGHDKLSSINASTSSANKKERLENSLAESLNEQYHPVSLKMLKLGLVIYY